jgi:hypothetical protein
MFVTLACFNVYSNVVLLKKNAKCYSLFLRIISCLVEENKLGCMNMLQLLSPLAINERASFLYKTISFADC